MRRRDFLRTVAGSAAALASGWQANASPAVKPNVIYIMLDELGYFELSCMGNDKLKTPNIDRAASEGMRFEQMLAGAPVCAPTRCTLMTGKHTGHSSIRANGPQFCLREEETTVADMFQAAGYATGGFGKWGCGDRGTTGVPWAHGFDDFFGYLHQRHAHSYFPTYLIDNGKKLPLEGNTGDFLAGPHFSHYLIYERSVEWLKQHKDRPFFLYLPWTPPHGQWGLPEDEPAWQLYKDQEWGAQDRWAPNDAQKYAAMVTMADRHIGEIFGMLKTWGIDDNTIVFITGDNGGLKYFKNEKHPEGVFRPNGGVFRGEKGDVYEGGLRVPYIVRWPGKIKPGTVSDHLGYFPDVMPTLAELIGVKPPAEHDGLSFVPALLGERAASRKQERHEYLYWEHLKGVAVRAENWKAVRPEPDAAWELYDLSRDVGEKNDLAARHPPVLKKLTAYAAKAHTPLRTGQWLDRAKGWQAHDEPAGES